MFGNDNKKMAGVILRGMKPPTEAEPTDDTSGDTEGDFEKGEGAEGLESAAEDLISAIHSKNAKGVLEAMRNYYTISGNASDYNPKTGQNDE